MARTETVTVMFSDLVGSTELASRLGHDGYETLRQAHLETLRAAVSSHNGTEIKTTGDGLTLCFTSAADLITAALAETESPDMPAEAAKLQRLREQLAHVGT
jgi:class 3 adenylate cyclase